MANTRSGNVIIVDTTAAFVDAVNIVAVRYEAGSGSPSVTIKADSSGGTVVYFVDGANDLFEQVPIQCRGGIHVTMAGTGTKAYLYLA